MTERPVPAGSPQPERDPVIKKAVNIVILLPLAIILILLSVANRQSTTLALNPFRPDDSVLSLHAPFFLFLFAALVIGMFIGSAATWIAQGKHRRRAHRLSEESRKWQTARPQTTAPATPVRQIEA